MTRLKPSTDIQPLSAFRANAAGFLKEVRESRRPLVLTQHGKSAAVVLDVEQYDALMEELEVIREIKEARAQLARGEGIPHEKAMAELRSRVSR
jgi:antitoxin YefM